MCAKLGFVAAGVLKAVKIDQFQQFDGRLIWQCSESIVLNGKLRLQS